MRRFAVSALCLSLMVLTACAQQQMSEPASFTPLNAHVTTEIFFSEYIEGSSNNKALEIYNGTLNEVDLSEYQVEMYFNGSATGGLTIQLQGSLAPSGVHVVGHASAVPAILDVADQTNGAGWFNGDDAVVLRRSGSIVDSIGQIGVDPGSEWGSGTASTSENTLRRLVGVCTGDTEAADAFDPAAQWSGFAQDTYDGLGSHANTGCTSGEYSASPGPQPEPDPVGVTPIYEVQGDGGTSPYAGSTVTIRGVVVGDFQEYGSLGGFFVQELEGDGLPETSDGIYVHHYSTAVEIGDIVEVTGDVEEFHQLTEVTGEVVVDVQGKADQEATSVTLPLEEGTTWEQYEGMLVKLESSSEELVVSEVFHLGRGGLVMLADERVVQFTQTNLPSQAGYQEHRESLERRTILLDDGSLRQNPDPIRFSTDDDELTARDTLRVGDTTDEVTGVVTYSWSGWGGTDAYRIHATERVNFVERNERPNEAPEVGGDIQVGSFNVLNFFNGDGLGGGFPTSRGADDEFELERQLDKLVSAIVMLDAEVLGLIEIENDAGPHSALADLVAALNDRTGAATYSYIDSGTIGSDEIKVALIYRPEAVSPTGPFQVLTSATDARFDDSKNRPALAQTFVEPDSGAKFTVVVNHLKSKGSSCSSLGDPDVGDGQGNCNETRTAAAEALADWADTLARESGDADVLMMGDLNAYALEDPIRALTDEGFDNLLESNEYTYVFVGESGTLDHALATASLASQVTEAAVWNINTEEPSVLDYDTDFKSDRHVELLYDDGPFRSSDHDPVIIGLDLRR